MMEEICKKCGNILVVDDNPMNIRLLTEMLKNEGYSVWPAPNGVRALAVLEKAEKTSPGHPELEQELAKYKD